MLTRQGGNKHKFDSDINDVPHVCNALVFRASPYTLPRLSSVFILWGVYDRARPAGVTCPRCGTVSPLTSIEASRQDGNPAPLKPVDLLHRCFFPPKKNFEIM